jgi:hypothetical protein
MNENPGLRSATGLRVRFVDDSDGSLSVLEIEIPRNQEVLGDVHQALFRVGVQIVNVELQVHSERIVERLRLVEKDGSAVCRDRHLEVQTTVLEVVQKRLVETMPPPSPSSEASDATGAASQVTANQATDTEEVSVLN